MRLEYDPDGRAAYIRLRDAPVVETAEVAPDVLMDLAADGQPVGFEFLDPATAFGGTPRGVEFILLGERMASARQS